MNIPASKISNPEPECFVDNYEKSASQANDGNIAVASSTQILMYESTRVMFYL